MRRILAETAMTALFVAAVALLGFYYYRDVLLAVVIMLVLAFALVLKIAVDSDLVTERSARAKLALLVSERVDDISHGVSHIADELTTRNRDVLDSLAEARHLYTVEAGAQYRELAKKIVDVENIVSETRKNLALLASVLDERMKRMEAGL